VKNHVAPLHATSVALGERWGCAELGTATETVVECWDAPRSASEPVRAFTVPWLRDKHIRTAPDRVCELGEPEHAFRCWQRPRRGESEGKEVPSAEEWLNPNHAGRPSVYSRADFADKVFVGGTFSCLQNSKDNGVWCIGDNRFGQLGGSKPVPPPNANRDDPAFVEKLWPAEVVAVGTWHACALAAPNSYAFPGHVRCWGRGDYGQLGVPAPDRCEVHGKRIPCSKQAIDGVAFADALLTLIVGDLYTCTSKPDDISCWGASRDGFFGKSAKCPASLRRAWPTLHGHVAAPRATCSLEPAPIRHVHGFQQSPSAGPRGICYDEDDQFRCVGGIHTPRGARLADVVVSPGEDASACGLRDGHVVCWGEGYSPPGAPDIPRPITLEIPPPLDEAAVLGPDDDARFSASCQVRKKCAFGPAPLPACAADLHVEDWSALWGSAKSRVGEVIHVRGAVAVGAVSSTMRGCGLLRDGQRCCNWSSGPVVLGDAPALSLDRLFCAGDDSSVCCNAPAYGDTLIATGRLESNPGTMDHRLLGYKLTGVTLCKPN
jgi:hypothetical protein